MHAAVHYRLEAKSAERPQYVPKFMTGWKNSQVENHNRPPNSVADLLTIGAFLLFGCYQQPLSSLHGSRHRPSTHPLRSRLHAKSPGSRRDNARCR